MPPGRLRAHTALKNEIRALNNDLSAEVYYKGGVAGKSGSGSVRLDVVKGDKMRPQAVYDLKTGTADHLTTKRIQQIRANLPPASRNIPIIEIRLDGTVIHN